MRLDINWFDKDSVIAACKQLNQTANAISPCCVVKHSGRANYNLTHLKRGKDQAKSKDVTMIYDPTN